MDTRIVLRLAGCLAAVAALALTVACGPEETPEQRLERLRYSHEIFPAGTTTLTDESGSTTVLIDVQVANQGTETLDALTVLVRVKDPAGEDRVTRRVTLDLTGVQVGVGVRRSARLEGVALAEGETVTVELEADLPADELRRLPEFSTITAG